MGMDDLQKLMAEIMENQREMQHHVVRMMERQSESEVMVQRIEKLTREVAENNIRLSRILEVHDYDIDQLDARLKRLEERRRNGGIQ